MAGKLTPHEIEQAKEKIRNRYSKLIRLYSKPRSIKDAFEERYINALKSKMDISIFLFAEIEAVDELLKKEEAKQEQLKLKGEAKEAVKNQTTFADKVHQENKKRLEKYERVHLSEGADEEMEYLIGAMRRLLNDYWPAIISVFKEKKHTVYFDKVNNFHHRLIVNYDYDGPNVPITKHYITALSQRAYGQKKLDYEHRYIIQESAFLLNEMADLFAEIIAKDQIPYPERKLMIDPKVYQAAKGRYYKLFNGKSYKDSLVNVSEFVLSLINDFRFRGIKRQY